MSEDLTFHDIETGLLGAVTNRQIALDRIEELTTTPQLMTTEDLRREIQESKEDVAILDETILQYVRAEVQKVDGIARILRRFDLFREEAKTESARVKRKEKQWENKYDHLAGIVISALNEVGKKKVETATNRLRIQKNSAASVKLEPGAETKIPSGLYRVNITMPGDLWDDILDTMTAEDRGMVKVTAELNLSLVAAKLKADPESVEGAKLEKGEHLRVE